MGLSYNEVVEAIKDYYNDGTSNTITWTEVSKDLAKQGYTTDNYYKLLEDYPTVFEVVKNADGSIRDAYISPYTSLYQGKSSIGSTGLSVNSNTNNSLMTNTVKSKIPSLTTTSSTGELTGVASGLGTYTTTGSTAIGVLNTATIAMGGVAVAGCLAKNVDKLLYEVNPNFWDSVGLQSVDPDTWSSFTSDDGLGGYLLNNLLALNDDGSVTQYMDENALAYFALYLNNNNVFTKPQKKVEDLPEGFKQDIQDFLPFQVVDTPFSFPISKKGGSGKKTETFSNVDNLAESVFTQKPVYNREKPFGYDTSYTTHLLISSEPKEYLTEQYTFNNKTVYYARKGWGGYSNTDYYLDNNSGFNTYDQDKYGLNVLDKEYTDPLAWLSLYHYTEYTGVEGVTDDDEGTKVDLSGLTTIADVLNALKDQLSFLWDNAITKDVVQPDGTTKKYTYVPVPTPINNDTNQPVSDSSTQTKPQVDPDDDTEPLIKQLIEALNIDETDTIPPDTGDGDTPPVTTPTGSASALYKVYNPTQEQLNNFGTWLWSSNFVDQILKLFNDPMQSIIALHKVFCTPSIGGVQDIKVGYLDSGVASNYIDNQYTTIDCGSVSLNEYFGNVFDYEPYTDVNIFLPFIGIQKLNVADIMRSTINVKYHCDVITGACLAEIIVTRDGFSQTLYTYSGNIAVQYPISSGSYMGIVSSLASVVGGAIGTITSGGSMLPLALGSMKAIGQAHTSVSHSGNFTGSSGAMGCKMPYLIISRPQTENASNYLEIEGGSSNKTVSLNSCSGFTKVKKVNLQGINATRKEIGEIENLLYSGVII